MRRCLFCFEPIRECVCEDEDEQPEGAERDNGPVTSNSPGPLVLAGVGHKGTTTLWLTGFPWHCTGVRIGTGDAAETHLIDRAAMPLHDGPDRMLVRLQTGLRRAWPAGMRVDGIG